MPRSYDSKVVALTVGHSFKWVDNLLSQNELPGVVRARQGIPRVITDDGLLAIELTRVLVARVAVPIAKAAAIARQVVESVERPTTRVILDDGIVVEIDVRAVEARLQARLLTAVEAVSRPRRGRPPRRLTAELE